MSDVPYGVGLSAEQYREGKKWAEDYALRNGYLAESFAEQQIRWNDQDVMGHCNNGVYTRFLEGAAATWNLHSTRRALKSQNESQLSIGAGVVIYWNLRYRSPTKFPDVLLIAHRVAAFDEKRFTLHGLVLSIKDRKVVCTSESGTRAWDMATGKPSTWNDAWYKELQSASARQEEQKTAAAKL